MILLQLQALVVARVRVQALVLERLLEQVLPSFSKVTHLEQLNSLRANAPNAHALEQVF